MRLFKDPSELTAEERAREEEAKAQVLAMFGSFRPDPTEGAGFKESVKQMWWNLAAILVSAILYLTGVFSEGLYVASIVTSFIAAIVISLFALFFARKDFLRANGS